MSYESTLAALPEYEPVLPPVLACADLEDHVVDLWTQGDPESWCCGNDDRSVVVSGASSADAALDAYQALRASLRCEACGDIDCDGSCPDCGAQLCALEAHDELCVIANPDGSREDDSCDDDNDCNDE